MMQLRVRIPSALYRRRLTAAGTNRRLTEILVEALRDETIFSGLLGRTDEEAVDEEAEPTDEDIDEAAQRHEELLRGPWRDS